MLLSASERESNFAVSFGLYVVATGALVVEEGAAEVLGAALAVVLGTALAVVLGATVVVGAALVVGTAFVLATVTATGAAVVVDVGAAVVLEVVVEEASVGLAFNGAADSTPILDSREGFGAVVVFSSAGFFTS